MREELEPCPFCGGEPSHKHSWDAHTIECAAENCGVQTYIFQDREKAVKLWNTRAQSPAALSERDALKSALIEARAELIYNGWRDQRGWVPWQAGGNSLKQDEARAEARKALEPRP